MLDGKRLRAEQLELGQGKGAFNLHATLPSEAGGSQAGHFGAALITCEHPF
jgi:hypothetical protein